MNHEGPTVTVMIYQTGNRFNPAGTEGRATESFRTESSPRGEGKQSTGIVTHHATQ